ncbi:MAG TPA: DUF177 domain-containing protein [Brevundimonas sp.]|nr:DUF177 domain-containing protein [Brevundimonas sp.]
MTTTNLPYSVPVRLHQVRPGEEHRLEPDEAARRRIAASLDLASLDSFVADVTLTTSGQTGWKLSGRVVADAVQSCGLTLEPLPVHIDTRFSVSLTEAVATETDEIDITMDDDTPDLIEEGQLDLGQYAVEQLALRLDPFPRKPGAEFVQPEEPVEISPFAVLKQLRSSDDG